MMSATNSCGPAVGASSFSSPSAVPALTDQGLALMCEPGRLPARIEDRLRLAGMFYGAIRRLPLATAVLLADTRRQFYPERHQSKAFFAWVGEAFERELNRTYVHKLCAIGELLLDTAPGVCRTCSTNDLHPTLCSLDLPKLQALGSLPVPTLVGKFWPKYGAALQDATRDEVREMVAEFRVDTKPAKKPKLKQLEFTELLAGVAGIPVDRLPRMAEVVRADQAVSVLRNATTVAGLVVEAGRMSPQEILDVLEILKAEIYHLVPMAKEAGIEITDT